MGTFHLLIFVSLAAAIDYTQGFTSGRPLGPIRGPFGPIGGPRGPIRGPFGPIGGPRGPIRGPFGPIGGPISRRDNVGIPEPVQKLVSKIEDLASDVKNGVATVKTMEQSFKEIASDAKDIIEKTKVIVTDQDVLSIYGDIAGAFLNVLITHPFSDSSALEFAVDYLDEIVERIDDDPTKVFIAVRAIEETAETVAKTLKYIRELFDRPFGKRENANKRQKSSGLTVGGNVKNGPSGPSAGFEASYKARNGAKVGGYFEHGPHGNTAGVKGSYTTKNGVEIGANFEHGPFGPGAGLSVSRTWNDGRTSVGAGIHKGMHGPPVIGIGFRHQFGKRLAEALLTKRQWNFGGEYNHGPGGTNWGLEASRTWKHKNGGNTTLGGNFNRGPFGNSYGIKFSHTFGKGRRSVGA